MAVKKSEQKPKNNPEKAPKAKLNQEYKGVFYFDANGNKVDPYGNIIK